MFKCLRLRGTSHPNQCGLPWHIRKPDLAESSVQLLFEQQHQAVLFSVMLEGRVSAQISGVTDSSRIAGAGSVCVWGGGSWVDSGTPFLGASAGR